MLDTVPSRCIMLLARPHVRRHPPPATPCPQATNFERKLYTLLNSGIALIGCEPRGLQS